MSRETIYFCVDRIEDGVAVLERDDEERLELPASQLPPGIREGDCVRLEDGAFFIDADETQRRRKINAELFKSLLED